MRTSKKQKSPFHGHNGPTAQAVEGGSTIYGTKDSILTSAQVRRANKRPLVVNKHPSKGYIPVVG